VAKVRQKQAIDARSCFVRLTLRELHDQSSTLSVKRPARPNHETTVRSRGEQFIGLGAAMRGMKVCKRDIGWRL